MKKLLLLTILAASIQITQAQDYKKVQTAALLNKWEDAKTEIDKILVDPKAQAKAESWYWKSKIYAALYKSAPMRAKYPTILKDADDAFKKYVELDPGFAQLKQPGGGPDGFFDMYQTTFAEAIKAFNLKKWDEAAADFLLSVTYSDYIFKNKWTKSDYLFDTTSILYLGYSYQNAGKPEEAVKYYGRLAENKVTGESFADFYKYLVDYYTKAKNEDLFKKYLALGRATYPKEPWDEFEMDYIDKNYTLAQKTEMYDKGDAAGTLNETQYLQFGDVFVSAKNKDKGLDSLQIVSYTLKAADAFKKAYAKNNQNAIAAFNVGVIYYNIYGDYDDKYAANIRAMQAINANKPPADKDPKKKAATDAKFKEQTDAIKKMNADIEKPLLENLDNAIDWIEKTYTILKAKTDRSKVEKSVINKSVDFLANLYAYKRDRNRGKDLKVYDALDAKYKEFDALHAKF
jgi:hypothetical protein